MYFCGVYLIHTLKDTATQTLNTMKNTIEIRVLEQDTDDQIRIGQPLTITNTIQAIDSLCKSVLDAYHNKLKYFGGFHTSASKFYSRIAIVDASSLELVRVLFTTKKEDEDHD